MPELKCPLCGCFDEDNEPIGNVATCDHCGHVWQIATTQLLPDVGQQAYTEPAQFSEKFPEDIVMRISDIVADAGKVVLIVVLPMCFPVIGFVAFGWLLLQLLDWYQINAKYGTEIAAIAAQPPEPFGADKQLAQEFQTAKYPLWIGTLFWFLIFAIAAYVVFVISKAR